MSGGRKKAIFVPKPVQSLLSDLRSALMMDLNSAGPDEVRGSPILKGRERLVVRIDRLLASASGTLPKGKPKAARRFDRYRVTLSVGTGNDQVRTVKATSAVRAMTNAKKQARAAGYAGAEPVKATRLDR